VVVEQFAILKKIPVFGRCPPNRRLCCMHEVDIAAPSVLAHYEAFGWHHTSSHLAGTTKVTTQLPDTGVSSECQQANRAAL